MKKLDLSGIQSAPTAARSAHPVIEIADSKIVALLTQWVSVNPQFKALKNQNETLAKQLARPIRGLYFERFKGIAPESSTMLVQVAGRTVKLIVKSSYSKQCQDDKALIDVLGQERVSQLFKQATVLKLDLDKVPEEKQEEFASGVIELAQKLGVSDAVSASQCIQPVAGFHEARTNTLSVDENMKIDAVLPITAYPQL